MLPFLKRFGKAALAVELGVLGSLYLVFRDINTGGPDARRKWDARAPWLIDAFHTVTGDERVVEHRISKTMTQETKETTTTATATTTANQ